MLADDAAVIQTAQSQNIFIGHQRYCPMLRAHLNIMALFSERNACLSGQQKIFDCLLGFQSRAEDVLEKIFFNG